MFLQPRFHPHALPPAQKYEALKSKIGSVVSVCVCIFYEWLFVCVCVCVCVCMCACLALLQPILHPQWPQSNAEARSLQRMWTRRAYTWWFQPLSNQVRVDWIVSCVWSVCARVSVCTPVWQAAHTVASCSVAFCNTGVCVFFLLRAYLCVCCCSSEPDTHVTKWHYLILFHSLNWTIM